MKLNKDGYFRKRWKNEIEMFHRYIYRIHNNLEKIPKGHEIDHICKCRACCNPKHLQLLTTSEHRSKDNSERILTKNLHTLYI